MGGRLPVGTRIAVKMVPKYAMKERRKNLHKIRKRYVNKIEQTGHDERKLKTVIAACVPGWQGANYWVAGYR